jgi:CSLREA domain-containing protein
MFLVRNDEFVACSYKEKTMRTHSPLYHLFIVVCLVMSMLSLTPVGTVQAVPPTTYTVNTLTDEFDASCSDGDCSLRDAIWVAISGDSINFSVTGTINLTLGQIAFGTTITITGPGRTNLTISTPNTARVFVVNGALTISDLTISTVETGTPPFVNNIQNNGTLSVTNVDFAGNNANVSNGGAIFHTAGLLSITNSTFSNYHSTWDGGAVYNSCGLMTITGSTFTNNQAANSGGAIYIHSTGGGVNSVTNSILSGNHATLDGGGINLHQNKLNVSTTTLSENTAGQDGGGIYALPYEGILNVTNSTFTGNSAVRNGGGLYNGAFATSSVTNTTFVLNLAGAAGGGGIYNSAINTTTAKNIIITNSSGGDCGGFVFNAASTNNMHNDAAPATCIGGFVSRTPVQLALGASTGSPAYYPLTAASVAVDAGNNPACPGTDQRGTTRPLDGDGNGTAKCDIGSFELEEPTTTTINSDSPDPSVTGQNVSVNVTVSSAGASVPTGKVNITGANTNCSINLAAGTGSCNVKFTSPGAKTITATYTGDATHQGSSTTTGHNVNKASTTITITSDNPDPSVSGQSVTVNFTVTVNSPGSGTPTGNVSVSDGVNSCNAQVAAGSCALGLTTVGARTLTATYAGDTKFNGDADTDNHQVNKASTTTTITSDNPDPSNTGQNVTVNFTVTVKPPGSGTATGNVTVSDSSASCTASVATGSCIIKMKIAGNRSLTATYAGSTKFNGSSDTENHQVKPKTSNFRSAGAQDGWVLESSATSSIGGSFDAAAVTFSIGDDQADRQCRAILSFNTATLPDTAVVTSVVLKIKKQSLVGTNPFTTHQGLLVDIRKPFFGAAVGLAAADFQATANKNSVGTFGSTPSSGWYSVTLNSTAFSYINKSGTTQFRLRFKLGDNDDNGTDMMKFYSGNFSGTSSRPLLIIQYYVP